MSCAHCTICFLVSSSLHISANVKVNLLLTSFMCYNATVPYGHFPDCRSAWFIVGTGT